MCQLSNSHTPHCRACGADDCPLQIDHIHGKNDKVYEKYRGNNGGDWSGSGTNTVQEAWKMIDDIGIQETRLHYQVLDAKCHDLKTHRNGDFRKKLQPGLFEDLA